MRVTRVIAVCSLMFMSSCASAPRGKPVMTLLDGKGDILYIYKDDSFGWVGSKLRAVNTLLDIVIRMAREGKVLAETLTAAEKLLISLDVKLKAAMKAANEPDKTKADPTKTKQPLVRCGGLGDVPLQAINRLIDLLEQYRSDDSNDGLEVKQ